MKVYDCFTFFNELDMLDIRLHELNGVVDIFVISEWAYTHSGIFREFVLEKHLDKFSKFASKIRYLKITTTPVENESWTNERFQRKCLERGLYDVEDNDIIMVSDLDEIPYPETVKEACKKTVFPQIVDADQYYYNFSTRTNTINYPDVFITAIVNGKTLKLGEVVINPELKIPMANPSDIRAASWKVGYDYVVSGRTPLQWSYKHILHGGWHLTYFSTPEDIVSKLKSFAHTEFSSEKYANLEYIKDRIKNSEDLFLRPSHSGWRVDWKTVRLPKLVSENPERFAQFLPRMEELHFPASCNNKDCIICGTPPVPLFSVVLIARNEEKSLPRLMNSLKEFQARGGEVILVDTGSTDGTAELARSLGCIVEEVGTRFIHTITDEEAKTMNELFLREPEDEVVKGGDKLFDFSKARNYAVTLAKNDSIAMPDCDEMYTAFNIDAINTAILEGVEQLEYNFVFSHDEFGKEAVKFLHSKFYDRRKMKWVRIVHEVLDGAAVRRWLPEHIIKLEHWQNPEQNRSGYLKGLAYDCYVDPKSDRNHHYFGRELLWTGRPRSAIKVLEKHIGMSWWDQERAESMIYIGDANRMLGDDKEALQWYHKAFMEDASRREALLKLGEYYLQKKDPRRTACYIEAALVIPHSNFYAVDQKNYTWFPHEMAYWAYMQMNDMEKAKIHYDKALAFESHRPNFVWDYRFFYQLPKMSFILSTLGMRKEGVERCVNSIKNLMYPPELIEIIFIEDTPRMGISVRLKEGVEKSTGEWIVFASDDGEFTQQCIMQAYFTHKKTGKKLISFNTGPLYSDEGNICEHFMIHKDLISQIGGEVFSTKFHHVGCDNLLWAKCKKLNEAIRSEDAIFIHHHFKDGKTPIDEGYKIGWSNIEEDRKILKEELDKLTAT